MKGKIFNFMSNDMFLCMVFGVIVLAAIGFAIGALVASDTDGDTHKTVAACLLAGTLIGIGYTSGYARNRKRSP